jgi:hypothetical protein
MALITGINAIQAYQIIRNLGNPKVHIFASGKLYEVAELVTEDCVRGIQATEVGPLMFWGGPPKRLQYYTGNLFTLLCDRILDRIQVNGYQAAREAICHPQPAENKVKVCL